jgi:hypothetical protein
VLVPPAPTLQPSASSKAGMQLMPGGSQSASCTKVACGGLPRCASCVVSSGGHSASMPQHSDSSSTGLHPVRSGGHIGSGCQAAASGQPQQQLGPAGGRRRRQTLQADEGFGRRPLAMPSHYRFQTLWCIDVQHWHAWRERPVAHSVLPQSRVGKDGGPGRTDEGVDGPRSHPRNAG